VSSIGRYNETDLHDQLKSLYAGEVGETEVEFGGYVVDAVRDGELIEVQTRGLGKLRRKIEALAADHRIRIVHPVAARTRLVKIDEQGNELSSRRSPKRGRIESVFRELTAVADILLLPTVTLEVVLVNVVEFRRDDGKGSWRRRGVSIIGRGIEEIVSTTTFVTVADYASLLPEDLPEQFTNGDLASHTGLRYAMVQPMTSCFRKMGIIAIEDKRGRELLYCRKISSRKL
jgi:hypothetical protein